MRSSTSASPSESAFFQTLDARRLFAAINISGTSGDDSIALTIAGNAVQVDFNGSTSYYTAVSSITISAGVMVMARRSASGIVRAMKPCMTTCPA